MAHKVEHLDNGMVRVTSDGVEGVAPTVEMAWAFIHCHEAADNAVPWDDDDEDGRAERKDHLATILCNVTNAYVNRGPIRFGGDN
jgi:hypothetical protein